VAYGGESKKMGKYGAFVSAPQSLEINPVEHLWCHIREKGNFKNHTFHSLCEVEMHLMAKLRKLSSDFDTVKNITRF
jgi:hypothetical protein